MAGDRRVLSGKGSHAGLISGTRMFHRRDVMGHAWGGVKGCACTMWGGGRRCACAVGPHMLPFAAQSATEAVYPHAGRSGHVPCHAVAAHAPVKEPL